MKKIIGIGELVWDMLPGGKQLGGAPVNFAYWCSKSGAEGYPISAIGNDELGEEAIKQLQKSGLNLDYIQKNELPTSRVLVSLNEHGIPSYEIVENVAWDAIIADPKSIELVSKADAICWGSLAQRSPQSSNAINTLIDAAPQNCLKVFDINIRQTWYTKSIIENSLDKANILKLNEDELPLVLKLLDIKDIQELIKKYNLSYLIFTSGADHSEIHDSTGLLSNIPTPKVKVADTVGAGDSFTASFITSLLAGESIETSHINAVETAAMVCTINGAM